MQIEKDISWFTKLIKMIVFISLGVVLFLGLQNVLKQKWYYPAYGTAPINMLEEFSRLSDNDNLQAIFLGTSSPGCGIDPMAIYEMSGIATFNLSTDAQPLAVSYFLCKEAFEQEHPEIVFLDVNYVAKSYDFIDTYYRLVLDNTPFSWNKAELAVEYASNYSAEKQIGSFIGSFLPLYRYHDRWAELGAVDFSPKRGRSNVRKGLYLVNYAVPSIISQEWMNTEEEMLSNNVGWTHSVIDGTIVDESDNSTLYEPTIDPINLLYLEKIKRLCDENGSKLILIRIPSMGDPQYSIGAWTRLYSNNAKKIAAEYSLDFLDLFYDVDLGIDWAADSGDGGWHLNFRGAQKVSAYLADYLQNECNLIGAPSKTYDEDLPIYHAVRRTIDLQMTSDLTSYLDKLSQWEDITVFFAAVDDMTQNLTEQNRLDLNSFGLETNFGALTWSDSFLAVVENGSVKCEITSNRWVQHSGVLDCGHTYSVISCGWLAGGRKERTLIEINGVNYSPHMRGLNIVVLDNQSGLVLDSVVFDTYESPDKQFALRDSSKSFSFLCTYEQYLTIKNAKSGIGA